MNAGRQRRRRHATGFTLIEVLVAVTVFAAIAVSMNQGFVVVQKVARLSRLKVTAVALANEQVEIARNLSFADVGIVQGIPSGKIPREQTLTRGGIVWRVVTTVRNIDDAFDGTVVGSPPDATPADYKLVDVVVSCPTCLTFPPVSLTTIVAVKGGASVTGTGVLTITVLDATGRPVPGAQAHVENTAVSPTINLEETTDDSGLLTLIGAPPSVAAYAITVTKEGYSTDRTYPPGDPVNPNPTKPHATVVAGAITRVSFAIDRVSTLTVRTVTEACDPASGVAFLLRGAKRIGTSPDVLKVEEAQVTDRNGETVIENLEWDAYAATVTSATTSLVGSIPLMPLSVIPGVTQELTLVVKQRDPQELLVAVKDTSSSLPLADAAVTLTKSGTATTLTTGRGFFRQTDWSGGAGQGEFTDPTRYFSDDGRIAVGSPRGEVKLARNATHGELESSTFDVGEGGELQQISWQPQDQPQQAGPDSLKFQVASKKNPLAAWTFSGPDGASNSFYTVPNTTINERHRGDRYLRYRVLLNTQRVRFSPTLADVAFTFTSLCVPPGQALFPGLSNGTYTLAVSRAGYQAFQDTVSIAGAWQRRDVTLTPQ